MMFNKDDGAELDTGSRDRDWAEAFHLAGKQGVLEDECNDVSPTSAACLD
jgi:hypothetical protein